LMCEKKRGGGKKKWSVDQWCLPEKGKGGGGGESETGNGQRFTLPEGVFWCGAKKKGRKRKPEGRV